MTPFLQTSANCALADVHAKCFVRFAQSSQTFWQALVNVQSKMQRMTEIMSTTLIACYPIANIFFSLTQVELNFEKEIALAK